MSIRQLLEMRDQIEDEILSWPDNERHGEEYYSRRQDLIWVKVMLRSR